MGSATSVIGSLSETRQEVLKVEWKIKDFLSSKKGKLKKSGGGSWKSPTFRFSNTLWYFRVFSSGEEEIADFNALFLCSDELNTCSRIVFTLAIQKTDGTLNLCTLVRKFQGRVWYGFTKNISWSDLLQKTDDFIVEGTITFICTLNNACPIEGMDSLSVDLKYLLESSEYSDLTVRLKSKTYKAHRAILAARSVFFNIMLDGTVEESGVLSIEDSDPDSFEEFLKHMYTNRANITEGNVFHLYKMASKYMVDDLKLHCVAFLMENLSVDNVCDVITLAYHQNDLNLKYFCKIFFLEKAGSILKTSQWKSFVKTNCEVASEMLGNFTSILGVKE